MRATRLARRRRKINPTLIRRERKGQSNFADMSTAIIELGSITGCFVGAAYGIHASRGLIEGVVYAAAGASAGSLAGGVAGVLLVPVALASPVVVPAYMLYDYHAGRVGDVIPRDK